MAEFIQIFKVSSCAGWRGVVRKNMTFVLTLTRLTPKVATQPQPPSGATFLVVFIISSLRNSHKRGALQLLSEYLENSN